MFGDALYKWSLHHSPGIEDPFGIILFVRGKGADPRPSPTEDRDNKGNLDFVAWMDEMIIVNGPEGSGKLDQLLSAE